MVSRELTMAFLRSCKKEISSPVIGEITGTIPEWLQGNLLRVGSGLLDIGPDQYRHLFDGLALLRKFSIQNGKVTYQNRFLRSDTYKKNMEANRIVVSEFGTRGVPDPCKTIFQRLFNFFKTEDFTDNDLVNIVKYTDEYYACSEASYIWKIDPENLESLKKVDLRNYVPVMSGTAHPHEDRNGSVFNVGNSKGSYIIMEFPPKNDAQEDAFDKGRVVGRIPMSRSLAPSYYHSFAITENYIIFVEQPLVLSVPSFMLRHFSSEKAFQDCLEWQPQYKTKFHVMRRDDGTLIKTQYTADAFMVFHHINAYEDDDQIVMDLCCYKSGDAVKALCVEALKEYAGNPTSSLSIKYESAPTRYILPTNVNEEKENNLVNLPNSSATAFLQQDGSVHCHPETLCESEWFTELPRINYDNFNGRKYRYFYAVGKKKDAIESHTVKVDVEKRNLSYWDEPGAIPSEPVFVPFSKSSQKEDEGVLLVSLLFNDNENKVALLVLDAETMKEMGRATFHVESSVPGDFHGAFISKTL